ncbi:MAG: hypothetical protein ONB52_21995 [candidate division KSB1 bacterium]|nr:hypothetical protein [candidate division KSB1 bacterium]
MENKNKQQQWAELDERYGSVLAIAYYRLRQFLDVLPASVLTAAAATLLIETSRMGLRAYPGLARQLWERIGQPKQEGIETPELATETDDTTSDETVIVDLP